MISGIMVLIYVGLYVFGYMESIGEDRGGLLALVFMVEMWLELCVLEAVCKWRKEQREGKQS